MSVHSTNKNFLLNLIGMVSQRLATFVLVALYTRTLTPEEFGLYSLVLLFVLTLSPLIISTVTGAVQRFYVEFEGEERAQCIGNAAFILFSTGVLALIVVSLLGQAIISSVFSDPMISYDPYFFLAQFSILPFLLISLHGAVFQAEGLPVKSMWIQIIMGIALILGGVYFVLISEKGLEGAIFALLFGTWATVPFMLFDLRKRMILKISLRYITPLLAFSLPILPHISLSLVKDSIDRVLIERLLGLADVGIYAVSLMLATVCGLIVSGYGNALSASMYRAYRDKGVEQAHHVISDKTGIGFSLVLFVYAGISLFAREVVQLLAGTEYLLAASLIPVLAFGYVVRYLWVYSYYNILYSKKTGVLPFISLAGLIVTVFLAVVLLPSQGVMGAAVAFVAGYAVMAMCGYVVTNRLGFRMPLCSREMLLGGVVVIGLVFTGTMIFDEFGLFYQIFFKTVLLAFIVLFLSTYGSFPAASILGKLSLGISKQPRL